MDNNLDDSLNLETAMGVNACITIYYMIILLLEEVHKLNRAF